MRHALLALFALTFITACADTSADEPTAPIETSWEPFEHGGLSHGRAERARFQIAPCAYPDVVELMPTCGLDMPLINGHRTSVLVELTDAAVEQASVRSSNGAVLALRDLHPMGERSGLYKLELHATGTGSADLIVEGADGIIDTLAVQVADAVDLELEVEGEPVAAEELEVPVGHSAAVYARPIDADGNRLNAYEVDWSLAGDEGVTNAVGDFASWIARVDGIAPGTTTLRVRTGGAAVDMALRVTR